MNNYRSIIVLAPMLLGMGLILIGGPAYAGYTGDINNIWVGVYGLPLMILSTVLLNAGVGN